jgi:hypothetical protein
LYAFSSLLRNRPGEATAGTVALELKEFQVHPLLGTPDLFQPLVEGLRTVAEQGKPVAGPERRVARAPERPV